MAAKLVKGANKHESATNCLKSLHWLPVRERVKFKILCLVFNALKGSAPTYLQNLITPSSTRRAGLRSNSKLLKLEIPRTKHKTFAARSFSYLGPYWWNQVDKTI